jgi:hypothetical protein
MSNELISIIVLIAIFLIGTTMGINMGVLGVVAAFGLGTALGVAEDDIFAGFPGDLFVASSGSRSCSASPRTTGRWTG